MSPEIPFSSLPQSIQDKRTEEETLRTLPPKLWNDCVGLLEQYGHDEDLRHSFSKKLEDFFKKKLKFSESSEIRIVNNSVEVKDGEDLNVTIFSFGVSPRFSPYIGILVDELDSKNFLVISNKDKKTEFWDRFSSDSLCTKPTAEDLNKYSQVIAFLKVNPSQKEES